MGRQSYFVLYNTLEEKTRILEVIHEHNQSDKGGENLSGICDGEFDGYGIILFGNGGGRYSTFNYFVSKSLNIQFYHSDMKNYIKYMTDI